MESSETPFKVVHIDEYTRRHNDHENRISIDQLEPGMFVEAYGRTRSLARREHMAVKFSARVDHLNKSRAHAAGRAGFQLVVFQPVTLKATHNERFVEARPESSNNPRDPLWWWVEQPYPMQPMGFAAVREGFLTQFADSQELHYDR